MKVILTIATIALFASCKPSKATLATNWLGKQVVLKSDCPENGTCTATREFDKGLNLGAPDELYPQIIEKENSVLIQYEYNRNKAENAQYADDFHKEELFLEIPSNTFKKKYSNESLQDVKLVFGRHCYCKGSAGYFRITEGTLKIDHSEKQTKVKLTFKAPVPQKFETVEFIVE